MQKSDPQIQYAKPTVLKLFIDKYGRPKKKPYYIAQIQTILEKDHFPWITHQAINQLIEEKALSKIELSTKFHDKVVFIYNAELENESYKMSLNAHIKSTCKLIDTYSEPSVCKALGEHLEGLVKAELRAQGFLIIGTHTREYENKKWIKTNHNLDFIAEHNSGQLKIGVEVKNTIPIIERQELNIKLDMCDTFGIKPVFAVRWLKPYTNLIYGRGGFSWIFKTQIYPPGFNDLTKILWKRLSLPVTVRTELPEKSITSFQNWVKNQTT